MKMRSRHPMTAAVCLVAALLVLSNAAQLGGAVVCVGSDGHIDIESLLEACCVSGTSGEPSGVAGLTDASSTCGDCTDVQFKVSPLRSKESRLSHPDLDAGCIACSLCPCNGRTVGTADAIDMDQHWHSLDLISVVVLLT